MNIKSQKGITMINLVIYVISFLIVASMISGITMFFYGNTNLIDKENYTAAEYNKFNMYLVKESEEKGNKIIDIQLDNTLSMPYIEFSNGNRYTLDKETHILYYNSTCLCEDVQDLAVEKEYESGKEVLKTKVEFTGKSYTTKYTMNDFAGGKR